MFFTERVEGQLLFLADVLRRQDEPTPAEANHFLAAARALTRTFLEAFRLRFRKNPLRKELDPRYHRSHSTANRAQLLIDRAPFMKATEQVEHQRPFHEDEKTSSPPSAPFATQSSQSSVRDDLGGLLREVRVLNRHQDRFYLEKDLQHVSLLPWQLLIPLQVLESPRNREARPKTENDIHGTDPIFLSPLGRLTLSLVSPLHRLNLLR
jgi:hypothetical protein